MSGRTDIAEAGGLNVTKISYVLSADAYVLGGVSSLNMDALKMPAGDRQAEAAHEDPYGRFDVSEALRWAMKYRDYDEAKLSEETGINIRAIYAITKDRSDARIMSASTVFPLCQKLIFHPDFLYGLRRMRQYDAYLTKYEAEQKKLEQAMEAYTEARRILREKRKKGG